MISLVVPGVRRIAVPPTVVMDVDDGVASSGRRVEVEELDKVSFSSVEVFSTGFTADRIGAGVLVAAAAIAEMVATAA